MAGLEIKTYGFSETRPEKAIFREGICFNLFCIVIHFFKFKAGVAF